MSNPRHRHTHWILAGTLALALPLTAAAHRHGGEHHGYDNPDGPGRYSADRHDGRGTRGDGHLPRMLAGLDLSATQREQVRQLMSAEREARRQPAEAQRRAYDDLHDLANAANFDEAQAKKLSEAAGKAQAEMALLRARSARQIHDLLTPEQRKAVGERRAQWRERLDTERDTTAKGR